jgi:hypothetical protein
MTSIQGLQAQSVQVRIHSFPTPRQGANRGYQVLSAASFYQRLALWICYWFAWGRYRYPDTVVHHMEL